MKSRNNPPRDHFEKLLEAPCTHHEGLVKHALKDCNLMKKLLTETMKKAPDVAKKVAGGQNHDDQEYLGEVAPS